MCHLFHANVSSGPWRSSFVRPSPTLNMSVGTTDPLHGSISSTRLSANNKREYNFVRIFRSKLNYSKRVTGFGNLIINYSSRGGCENVPEQKCKVVPRQVCQQGCSDKPMCNQCDQLRNQGIFSSCSTGTCPNYFPEDPVISGNWQTGGGYNPGNLGDSGFNPGNLGDS